MAYELKEGQITLFKNKKTTDNQPYWKCSECLINGQIVELSLWEKQTKNGETYFAGKIQNKRNPN